MDKKSRTFLGVIYPDSESYDYSEVLDQLDSVFQEWAYILHDCDADDNGECKKEHIHWIGKMKTPALISTIANKLGVPDNSIEFCHRWKQSAQYLVHLNDSDKFRYDVKQICSNFNVGQLIEPVSSEDMAKSIFSKVIQEGTCSAVELCKWSLDNGLWSEFRRSYVIWKDIMYELKQDRG